VIITTVLLAAILRIDPPSPDTFTRIKVTFAATVCGPPVSEVTMTGNDIDIVVHGHGACILLSQPFPMNAYLGPLPAGIYTVRTKAGTVASAASFIVRDTSRVTFAPYAAPITGGVTTFVERAGSPPYRRDVPPSPAGLTGVTVEPVLLDDLPLVQPNAFIYFDPAQPPDVTHAEPVLFPIAFDGDGALGSQWRTENTLVPRTPGPGPVLYRPLCDGCPAQITTPTKLPSTSRPDGYLLWLGLGSGELLNATSRIRDLSREADNLGTAIPVVRRRDFASSFLLAGIPADARYRALLRVWSLDDDPVAVTIESPGYHAPLQLTRINAGGALFGSLDLNDAIVRLPTGTKTFDVRVSAVAGTVNIWPMISITNNDTQQVTIFAPEHR
jgi:hypothetical protein